MRSILRALVCVTSFTAAPGGIVSTQQSLDHLTKRITSVNR
jgi:hypothetical protein